MADAVGAEQRSFWAGSRSLSVKGAMLAVAGPDAADTSLGSVRVMTEENGG
jgi:hypothetical protein